jgi:hypothetical protein
MSGSILGFVMKQLLVLAILLTACSPQPKAIPSKQWLLNPLTALPAYHDGWHFIDEGGSGESGSCEFHARIILKGKTYGQAMYELHDLIESRVKNAGFTILGGGKSSAGASMVGFSISAKTPDSIGIIVVSSTPVYSSSLVLAIAVSQQHN